MDTVTISPKFQVVIPKNIRDRLKLKAGQLGLTMADSIVLATAQAFDATLWTQDADFAHISGVQYVERKPTG